MSISTTSVKYQMQITPQPKTHDMGTSSQVHSNALHLKIPGPGTIKRLALASATALGVLFHPLLEPRADARNGARVVTSVVENAWGSCGIEHKYDGIKMDTGSDRLAVYYIYPAAPLAESPRITCDPADGQNAQIRLEIRPMVPGKRYAGGEVKKEIVTILVNGQTNTYEGNTTGTTYYLIDTEGITPGARKGSRIGSGTAIFADRLQPDIVIPLKGRVTIAFPPNVFGVFRLYIEQAVAVPAPAPPAPAAPVPALGPEAPVQVERQESVSPTPPVHAHPAILLPNPESMLTGNARWVQLHREREGNQMVNSFQAEGAWQPGGGLLLGLQLEHTALGLEPEIEPLSSPRLQVLTAMGSSGYVTPVGKNSSFFVRAMAGIRKLLKSRVFENAEQGTDETEADPPVAFGGEIGFTHSDILAAVAQLRNDPLVPGRAQLVAQGGRFRLEADALWVRLFDHDVTEPTGTETVGMDASIEDAPRVDDVILRALLRGAIVDRPHFMLGLVAGAEAEQKGKGRSAHPMGGLALEFEVGGQRVRAHVLGTAQKQLALQLGIGGSAYHLQGYQFSTSGEESIRELEARFLR